MDDSVDYGEEENKFGAEDARDVTFGSTDEASVVVIGAQVGSDRLPEAVTIAI